MSKGGLASASKDVFFRVALLYPPQLPATTEGAKRPCPGILTFPPDPQSHLRRRYASDGRGAILHTVTRWPSLAR